MCSDIPSVMSVGLHCAASDGWFPVPLHYDYHALHIQQLALPAWLVPRSTPLSALHKPIDVKEQKLGMPAKPWRLAYH